jgi:transcriptional regulator with XRE-family HTH domain
MANFIKQIRLDRDLTAQQLADMLHTTQQQISLLEKKTSLRWEWIVRIANALQCHPLDITEGPAVPRTPAERDLIQNFRALREPGKQQMFVHMIEAAAKQQQKAEDKP